jgi:hypothetical protein
VVRESHVGSACRCRSEFKNTGCSSEFTGTRVSVLSDELSSDGGRKGMTVNRVGKSEGRENTRRGGHFAGGCL